MAFQAQCLFCGQKLKVPDHALGTSGKCPKCNSFFTLVPGEEAPTSDKAGPYGRLLSRAASPRAPGSRAKPEAHPASATIPAPMPAGHGVSADEEPPAIPWIEPFGLGALLLSGGALLCASSQALAGLVLWLSVLAILTGLLSLLRILVVGQFRLLFPVAGTMVAFAVLASAVLFPGFLGPTYFASRVKGTVDSTTIRMAPLKGGPVNSMDNPDWVDASRWALHQGSQRIQVNKVWLGPLTPGAKTKDENNESNLFIQVNVQQVESPGEFSSQAGDGGMDQGLLRPRLMDKSGKVYAARVAGVEGTLENSRKSELFPVAMRDHVFIFAAPRNGLELRLEISAHGDKFFRFQIPAAMIQKANPPSLAGN
jgi:hypothetical protein